MKNLKGSFQNGFTLIELMITIAIIGILVSVGLPAYNNYIAKAQVAEAFQLADAAKNKLVEHRYEKGLYAGANSNAEVGFDGASGKNVLSVNISAGSIIITFRSTANKLIAGKTIVLSTYWTGNNIIRWTCTGTAGRKYLPKSCNN